MKYFFAFLLIPYIHNSYASYTSCGGVEPFWKLSLEKKSGRFSSAAGELDRDFTIESSVNFNGLGPKAGENMKLRFRNNKKGSAITVLGSCSDGMSDQLFAYKIILDLGEEGTFFGCCNKIQTYEVVNVKSDDVLNVRRAPMTKSQLLYALPNETNDIEVLECKDSWCQINWSSYVKGWVNKKYIRKITRP